MSYTTASTAPEEPGTRKKSIRGTGLAGLEKKIYGKKVIALHLLTTGVYPNEWGQPAAQQVKELLDDVIRRADNNVLLLSGGRKAVISTATYLMEKAANWDLCPTYVYTRSFSKTSVTPEDITTLHGEKPNNAILLSKLNNKQVITQVLIKYAHLHVLFSDRYNPPAVGYYIRKESYRLSSLVPHVRVMRTLYPGLKYTVQQAQLSP